MLRGFLQACFGFILGAAGVLFFEFHQEQEEQQQAEIQQAIEYQSYMVDGMLVQEFSPNGHSDLRCINTPTGLWCGPKN